MSRMNIVIGQVMKRHKMRPELVKVRYLRLVLDNYLLKYFNKRFQCWAEDRSVKGDIGDMVLLKTLEEQKIPEVRHEVIEMVYKLGAIVDPVTGRRCRGKEYIEEAERLAQKQFIESEKKS
ncbi:28S ribosomal protein S17, mitochondrial-like [Gigantopelta aegis]|uniref:28S ribosomal protein S17, mitochondrial-like n=1 Tax=Gigantopelta aegis TaxID=1735272 RepID=UPI001B8879BA|nr:28S ribosomal protein S17, mitochondrial-like [Gigantopelta aegis]